MGYSLVFGFVVMGFVFLGCGELVLGAFVFVLLVYCYVGTSGLVSCVCLLRVGWVCFSSDARFACVYVGVCFVCRVFGCWC